MKEYYLKVKEWLCDISSDKYLHCMVCMMLVQIIVWSTLHIGWALWGTLGIAVAKEVFDKFVMNGEFSLEDLEADCSGIVLGIGMVFVQTMLL